MFHLDEGAVVTATRSDNHYAFTEYSIAKLRGKSVPDWARALINIAQPDFRSDLKKEFPRTYNWKIRISSKAQDSGGG